MLGSHAARRLWACLLTTWLALAVGLSGCADRTSLLITVTSQDFVVPDDVDRIDIAVRGMTTGMTVERSFPLSAPWPHSLAVRPGMVESTEVRITVIAYHGDDFVTRRVIHRAFSTGLEEGVEVVLAASCRNVRCSDEANDCLNGNCVGEMRDAGPPPDSGLDAAIDGGVDANLDAPCPSGFTNCGGACINPLEHPQFCGADLACAGYTRCVGNESCISGVCTLDCDPGSINCGGYCVNPQSDRRNCGASNLECVGGVECPAGEYCALGGCTASCPPGLYLCFGNCVDPLSDRQYCGADSMCNNGRSCFAGEQCSGGNCVTTCPADQIACSGRCVDTQSDRIYCGASADCRGGTTCPAGQLCVAGVCGASCPAPQIACGGRCVDPQEDEGYCGANSDCTGGTLCSPGFICRDGSCITNCPAGQVGCDGRCIDPMTDEAYCNASAACTGYDACGAREFCIGGSCGCQPPERECGGGCVDTRYDPNNCGVCGRVCPAGQACATGTCQPLSGGGFTGGFGATWTTLPFREVNCLQEFVPRASTDLYAGGGANFGAFDMNAMTYRAETSPPFAIANNCSFAYYGSGIFQVASMDVVFFQPPTHEWRTAPMGMDLGAVGMSVTDLDSIWTANAGYLIRGAPATSTVDAIPIGATLVAPRLTYDQLTGRIYFAGQGSVQVRSYDPVTRSMRIEGSAPRGIGPGFCGDRAGHLYINSQMAPRRFWQYTPTSGRWVELPEIPGTATGTTNCAIAEAGALYVAASPGTALYRLPLDRL